MFEHETGDAEAVHFVAEFLHAGVSVPFILLTEEADEKTIAEIIQDGTLNCVAKSQLDGATLVLTIRNTLTVHSLQQEQQTAEQSLRKLSRAVEQSADTILITDLHGIIEYVNPAFEALTGYPHDEVCGKTPRLLKSGEQGPETYQEIWKTILAGTLVRRSFTRWTAIRGFLNSSTPDRHCLSIRTCAWRSSNVNGARLWFRKIGGTALHRQRRRQTLAHANRQQRHRRLTAPKSSLPGRADASQTPGSR